MADVKREADKVQIGMTEDRAEFLKGLMETGLFAERQDVYRLAIATALSQMRSFDMPRDVTGASTAYSYAGGIDRDGKVTALIELFAPDDAAMPARTAEKLAHVGLGLLYTALIQDHKLFQDIFPSSDQ